MIFIVVLNNNLSSPMYCSEVFFKKNISSSSFCCAGFIIIILVSSIRSTPNVLQYILNISYVSPVPRMYSLRNCSLIIGLTLSCLGNNHFFKIAFVSDIRIMYIIQLIHRHLSLIGTLSHYTFYIIYCFSYNFK